MVETAISTSVPEGERGVLRGASRGSGAAQIARIQRPRATGELLGAPAMRPDTLRMHVERSRHVFMTRSRQEFPA